MKKYLEPLLRRISCSEKVAGAVLEVLRNLVLNEQNQNKLMEINI